MKTFKYGEIMITIESLQIQGDWEEYGARISAPGLPTKAFRTWRPTERDKQIVAQVLIYDLIEAYEDPQGFLIRVSKPSFVPQEYASLENNRDFIHVAYNLRDFLYQAHLDVYKEWALKPLKSDPALFRGPREWMP